MNTDPIADFLTRIRNGALAGHKDVLIPHSKLKQSIAQVLLNEGYIKHFEVYDNAGQFKQLRVVLKYDPDGRPTIRSIKRVSRPGLRRYYKVDNLPRVLSGAGVSILSTNKGIITDRQARHDRVGGEILCTVY